MGRSRSAQPRVQRTDEKFPTTLDLVPAPPTASSPISSLGGDLGVGLPLIPRSPYNELDTRAKRRFTFDPSCIRGTNAPDFMADTTAPRSNSFKFESKKQADGDTPKMANPLKDRSWTVFSVESHSPLSWSSHPQGSPVPLPRPSSWHPKHEPKPDRLWHTGPVHKYNSQSNLLELDVSKLAPARPMAKVSPVMTLNGIESV